MTTRIAREIKAQYRTFEVLGKLLKAIYKSDIINTVNITKTRGGHIVKAKVSSRRRSRARGKKQKP